MPITIYASRPEFASSGRWVSFLWQKSITVLSGEQMKIMVMRKTHGIKLPLFPPLGQC